MLMYNVVLPILFLSLFISRIKPKSKELLYGTVLLLLFFATFKGLNVGTDSYEYWDTFTYVHKYLKDDKYSGLQSGFIYFTLAVHNIGGYSLYLLVCYSICLFGYASFFQKCSMNNSLSFLMFFMLAYYISSLNIMRQYMAMGIYVVGLTYLYNGQKKPYVLLTLLASLFHYTAIIFLPLVFIDKITSIFSKPKIVIVLVITSLVLGSFFKSHMFNILLMVIERIYNIGYVDWIASNFEMERHLISNLGLNAFFLSTYLLSKNRSSIFMIIWALGVMLCNMFGNMDQANRIFLYLNMGILIVVPETLYNIQKRYIKYGYFTFLMCYLSVIWIYLRETNEVLPYVFR